MSSNVGFGVIRICPTSCDSLRSRFQPVCLKRRSTRSVKRALRTVYSNHAERFNIAEISCCHCGGVIGQLHDINRESGMDGIVALGRSLSRRKLRQVLGEPEWAVEPN